MTKLILIATLALAGLGGVAAADAYDEPAPGTYENGYVWVGGYWTTDADGDSSVWVPGHWEAAAPAWRGEDRGEWRGRHEHERWDRRDRRDRDRGRDRDRDRDHRFRRW